MSGMTPYYDTRNPYEKEEPLVQAAGKLRRDVEMFLIGMNWRGRQMNIALEIALVDAGIIPPEAWVGKFLVGERVILYDISEGDRGWYGADGGQDYFAREEPAPAKKSTKKVTGEAKRGPGRPRKAPVEAKEFISGAVDAEAQMAEILAKLGRKRGIKPGEPGYYNTDPEFFSTKEEPEE